MAKKKNRSEGTNKRRNASAIQASDGNDESYVEEEKYDSSDVDEYEDEDEYYNKIQEDEKLPKWFDDLPEEPEDCKPSTEADITQLREEAKTVLENDTIHYKNKCSQGPDKSNNEWLQTMLVKGTSHDRIAAAVIMIQNSPIHSLQVLRNLIGHVKTAKTECVKAMETLTDLLISDLLIPYRPLRQFHYCPLSNLEEISGGDGKKRKMALKLWYFEDQLKSEYTSFILAVKDICQNAGEPIKYKALYVLRRLLIANSEQEKLILSTLINKFGDPSYKVAAKVVTNVQGIFAAHPNMKSAVVKEVEKVIFRPNIPKRAQYYAVCSLTQIWLDFEDRELACMLVNLYFSLFKACVKMGEVDSRLMGAILTGVNRAFPFAIKDQLQIKEHVEILHKLVHIAPFRVCVQALCLLFQVCDYSSQISDRFYMALYKKILDPALSSSPQHAIFLSLIFRSLSKDLNFKRVKTFIKRLLQVCHYLPANLVCAILVMISHLFKKNESLKCLTLYSTKFEDDNEDGEEHYVDIKPEIEENGRDLSNKVKEETDTKPVIPTWYHVANLPNSKTRSDIYGRNPLFVHDIPVYTELVSLTTHHHPSVSNFASRLLEGALIDYPGDPLSDFTLVRFLDRWVFRNPKKTVENKDLNEPYFKRFARKPVVLLHDLKSLPTHSEDYLNTPEKLIPPDELFLYRFLKKEESEGKFSKTEKKNGDDDDASDGDSVASDEFEAMMDQLMGGKETIPLEDLDYAGNISNVEDSNKKKKKKKKKNNDEESSSSDDEISEESENESDESEVDEHSDVSEYDDVDDNEMDFDQFDGDFDDDKEVLEFDSDGEENFEFNMSDVERDEQETKLKRNGKKLSSRHKKITKMKNSSDDGIFAPAEEFAEMLEDTGEEIAKYGNLTNISNRDNAGVKQLQWEMKRHHQLEGKGRKRKHSGKSKPPSKKGKKRR